MKRLVKVITALILFLSLLLTPLQLHYPSVAKASTPYTEYYVVYSDNYDDGSGAILFITSPRGAYGTVEIPGLGWSQTFSVMPDQVTKVGLPLSAEVQGSDVISNLGIHVRASHQILVYLLNPGEPVYTNDAYTALPLESLGSEYLVMAWPDTLRAMGLGNEGPSELAVLAPYNATTLTITPSTSTGTRTAGVPYTVTLNQFDVYTLQDDGANEDLTGTSIQASKPVALFSGNRCVDIPEGYPYCDHIVEEMLPINTWGKSYITYPLASKYNGDFLRIISATDGNSVTINGAATVWQMPTAVAATKPTDDAPDAVLTRPGSLDLPRPTPIPLHAPRTAI